MMQIVLRAFLGALVTVVGIVVFALFALRMSRQEVVHTVVTQPAIVALPHDNATVFDNDAAIPEQPLITVQPSLEKEGRVTVEEDVQEEQPFVGPLMPLLAEDDATKVLAVQREQAQKYCFGADASFYESQPLDVHVHEDTDGTVRIDNQLLVQFVRTVTDAQVLQAVAEMKGTVVGCIAATRLYQVQFESVPPNSVGQQEFLRHVEGVPGVQSARMYVVEEREDGE